MGDLVQFTKSGSIAVITINNPPVNALSPGVPEGLAESIEKLEAELALRRLTEICPELADKP